VSDLNLPQQALGRDSGRSRSPYCTEPNRIDIPAHWHRIRAVQSHLRRHRFRRATNARLSLALKEPADFDLNQMRPIETEDVKDESVVVSNK